MKELSPSQIAKQSGLKSLHEVSQLTGVSEQTLINWHKNKKDLFNVVVDGAANKKNGDSNDEATS